MPHLQPSRRALIKPRVDLLDAHVFELVDDLILAPLGDPAEQFRDVHQRRALVGELKPHLLDIESIFAAAFEVVVDCDFDQPAARSRVRFEKSSTGSPLGPTRM